MNEVRVRRARMRAWRRGFREADLILGAFADAHLADMDAATFADFERLLEVDDQDLYAWIVGRAPAPPEFDTPVLAALRKNAWAGLTSDRR